MWKRRKNLIINVVEYSAEFNNHIKQSQQSQANLPLIYLLISETTDGRAALMALIPLDTRVWAEGSYDRHFIESIKIYENTYKDFKIFWIRPNTILLLWACLNFRKAYKAAMFTRERWKAMFTRERDGRLSSVPFPSISLSIYTCMRTSKSR